VGTNDGPVPTIPLPARPVDVSNRSRPAPSADDSDDDAASPDSDEPPDASDPLRTALGALRARLAPVPDEDKEDDRTDD
jgi:hypothetical protein